MVEGESGQAGETRGSLRGVWRGSTARPLWPAFSLPIERAGCCPVAPSRAAPAAGGEACGAAPAAKWGVPISAATSMQRTVGRKATDARGPAVLTGSRARGAGREAVGRRGEAGRARSTGRVRDRRAPTRDATNSGSRASTSFVID